MHVTPPNLPDAVTGGETDRRRESGQQSLIQTQFGVEATANRNRNNILDRNNVILVALAPFWIR